jgi:hypothetical protein
LVFWNTLFLGFFQLVCQRNGEGGLIDWKIRTRHEDVESEVKNGKSEEVLLNIKRSVKENKITDIVLETSLNVCAIV